MAPRGVAAQDVVSGKLQRAKTRQQYLDGTLGNEGNRTLGGNAEKLGGGQARGALALGPQPAPRQAWRSSTPLEMRTPADALVKLKLVSDYLPRPRHAHLRLKLPLTSNPQPESTMNVEVITLFKQAALEVNGKKLDNLTPDTVISKLGLDSVAVMELVAYFEEKLEIRMPDEDLARVQTLRDLATLVERLVPPGTQVQA